ncbi:MAG: DUF45 domain-containing protein [Prevotella sp.]|nr:DUF45 domain-containing protein [Prevotella sp.]
MAIEITYRRTKRLSMRIVKNGDVHVSAPIGTPRDRVLQFVNDNKEWIAQARKSTYERQKQQFDFFHQLPLQTREQCNEAANRLLAIVKPLCTRYAKLMGVHPSGYVIKTMTSRWGRCNVRTGEIAFSIYLLLLPEWCIEHVVVHELAHLIEANHGPRFHALMDQYFPRWREARRETRRLSRAAIAGDDDETDDL